MDKTIVSKRLLSTIEEKGMSYGEVAKLTGIPKSAVHRYSTGETVKIPIDRIESMASVLGVSAAYLMGWDNATADIADEEPKYLLASRSADNKEVQELTKTEYEALKNLISTLRQNDNDEL